MRIEDPGTATVVLRVRDLDALVAKLKQAGTPVVTRGGAPVTMQAATGTYRAIVVRDPDGHFVEFRQPEQIPADAPPGVVIGAHVRIAIADTDATMRLYRDLLGFQPRLGLFSGDKTFAALTGLPDGAQYRLTNAPVPGRPELTLEFIEFRGVDRKPLRSRIQDPGSVRLSFNVRDLDAAVTKFTSTGGAVVTTGGKPVSLGQGAPPHPRQGSEQLLHHPQAAGASLSGLDVLTRSTYVEFEDLARRGSGGRALDAVRGARAARPRRRRQSPTRN